MTENFEQPITQEPTEKEQKIIKQYNLTNNEWLRYRLTAELPERESVIETNSVSDTEIVENQNLDKQYFLLRWNKLQEKCLGVNIITNPIPMMRLVTTFSFLY